MQEHFQTGGGTLQARPWTNGEAPWERDNDDRLKQTYEANTPIILDNHQESSVSSSYNFPITNGFTISQLMRQAEEVYDRQQNAFRLNLEFGLILRNTETDEYRYFHPYSNESLFQRPIYVSRRQNLNRLRLRLERFNVTDFVLRQINDTKWKPYLITNVRFVLYNLNYPLGHTNFQLLDYLVKSKSIVCLHKNSKGIPYSDRLCAFRCLAVHRGYRHESLERHTHEFFRQWQVYTTDKEMGVSQDIEDFRGLQLVHVAYFERCFQTNVNIFRLEVDGTASSVYKSLCRYKDSMHLNMFGHHLSYISNLQAFTEKYVCGTCDRHFKRHDNMHRHQKTCSRQTKYVFRGGFYSNPKTVFDKLEEQGINIPVEDRLFEWFVVYDFESMLVPIHESNSDKLTWTQKHVPVSVSICSNVDGYRNPHCIVQSDVELLVRDMIRYMTEIANKSYSLAKEKFVDAFDRLDNILDERCAEKNDFLLNEMLDDAEWQEEVKKMKELYEKLKEELDAYCRQTICLGFNSSNYDLNLIKTHIAKQLKMHEAKNNFTVKRNNQYACMANDTLKFLDITSYLAPGVNYSKFLKAFDVRENKGYFCYEWFQSVDQLCYPSIPPHSAFYSTLKDNNITPEEYAFCQDVWRDHGMSTFKDFLIWYNNQDVVPFVKAVENLRKFYFERQIDLFKTSISVPGIARKMLFDTGREAGASFALFDEANKDLYFSIKNNLTGGPSTIFHRFHEVGKTFIRNNPNKPTGKIVGYDSNALYLWAIDQEMPTGPFVRRRVEDGFKPKKRDRFMLMYDWLDYIAQRQRLRIQHKLNTGKEKKIDHYPVDGYDESSNTVFQFHGCYWHGHDCWVTKKITDQKWRDSREDKMKRTKKTTASIQRQGYRVVEMWECHFKNMLQRDSKLKAFVESRKPTSPQRSLTENEILQAVVRGDLFGMVECDIRVPEQWPSHFRHSSMTPYEYFEEMCPLFCTTDVPFDVIGNHMQDHVRQFGLSEKPRRLLIGGMRARQMLLATPLLKWYLEHGMVVTKIYQVIEFTPRRCFQDFVKEVSDNRRLGDCHPDKAIIADTSKLHGNSAYGGTIMDQEKFQSVKYVQGEGRVMLEVNKPQFKKN